MRVSHSIPSKIKFIYRCGIFGLMLLFEYHLRLFGCYRLVLVLVSQHFYCPVGWGCRIHKLHFCRGLTPPLCSVYDPLQSDGGAPVMLKLYGVQSTPSLPLFPGPLWSGVVAPDMDQIELDSVLVQN